ncbi:sugar ABC transporter ATP-binding protein, partial [Burkholderia cenocepacia]
GQLCGCALDAPCEVRRVVSGGDRAGVGFVVMSGAPPELRGVAARVRGMRGGEIAGEPGGHTHTPITQEALIALATGSHSGLAEAH